MIAFNGWHRTEKSRWSLQRKGNSCVGGAQANITLLSAHHKNPIFCISTPTPIFITSISDGKMTVIVKLSLFIAIAITHLAAGAHAAPGPVPDASLHTSDPSDADPLFCVVVRTYWGHGDATGGGLRHLLRSLQNQTHQR
jgi:hypothetical protein